MQFCLGYTQNYWQIESGDHLPHDEEDGDDGDDGEIRSSL